MDGWIDRYPHYITIGFAKFLFIYTVYIYIWVDYVGTSLRRHWNDGLDCTLQAAPRPEERKMGRTFQVGDVIVHVTLW